MGFILFMSDVCILEMKKKPVNSLGLEFLTELNIALEQLQAKLD